MVSRIIIGVDGAGGGLDALALSRRIASPATELIAVSVATVRSHPAHGVNFDFDRDARETV